MTSPTRKWYRLYRWGIINKGEYDAKVGKYCRSREESEERNKRLKVIQCVFCCACADFCFEEGSCKKYCCAASMSGMFYGAITTTCSAVKAIASSVGLGIGISAIVLGSLCSIGVCVCEYGMCDCICCRETDYGECECDSVALVDVQPGDTQ